MFMLVFSFYLYSSMAVKDGCSMLTVECKASDNRTMHLNYNPGQNPLQPPDLQILKMADQTEQFFPLHLRILAR